MNYRNKKLLEVCRALPCTICRSEDGTVCAAHSNQQRDNKGTGIKADDYRIAALCHKCHMDVDQGTAYTKAQRQAMWEEAHRATMGLLFRNGLVDVA